MSDLIESSAVVVVRFGDDPRNTIDVPDAALIPFVIAEIRDRHGADVPIRMVAS